jgi:hypothetical protein
VGQGHHTSGDTQCHTPCTPCSFQSQVAAHKYWDTTEEECRSHPVPLAHWGRNSLAHTVAYRTVYQGHHISGDMQCHTHCTPSTHDNLQSRTLYLWLRSGWSHWPDWLWATLGTPPIALSQSFKIVAIPTTASIDEFLACLGGAVVEVPRECPPAVSSLRWQLTSIGTQLRRNAGPIQFH